MHAKSLPERMQSNYEIGQQKETVKVAGANCMIRCVHAQVQYNIVPSICAVARTRKGTSNVEYAAALSLTC